MPELFNDWQAAAAADFCHSLGFEGAMDGETRAVNIVIGNNDYLLNIERDDETLVLAVFKEVAPADLDRLSRQLLEKCSYEHYHGFLVQIGMDSSMSLVLGVRLGRLDAARLIAAYELIRQLYRAVGL